MCKAPRNSQSLMNFRKHPTRYALTLGPWCIRRQEKDRIARKIIWTSQKYTNINGLIKEALFLVKKLVEM